MLCNRYPTLHTYVREADWRNNRSPPLWSVSMVSQYRRDKCFVVTVVHFADSEAKQGSDAVPIPPDAALLEARHRLLFKSFLIVVKPRHIRRSHSFNDVCPGKIGSREP